MAGDEGLGTGEALKHVSRPASKGPSRLCGGREEGHDRQAVMNGARFGDRPVDTTWAMLNVDVEGRWKCWTARCRK